MEKYLINYKSTFDELEDAPIVKEEFVLGILGNSSSSKWTRETMADLIMNPLLEVTERIPNKILMPTEGTTSVLLQVWAERHALPFQAIDSDWMKMGRRARALRDSRILKESTHLLIFLGARSDYYERVAIREAKKGKVVFTVDKQELVQWVL